jgi:uncharacterized membrane protein YfcA
VTLTASIAVLIGLALGLLGGGGSTLAVPLLIFVAAQPGKVAIATSLLVVAVTSVIAAISHARDGHVHWRGALVFAPSVMLGSYVGGHFAKYVNEVILIGGFSVMMLATAVAMWRARGESSVGSSRPVRLQLVVPLGLAVGLVTGLVGAGGGFLVVPALALIMGMSVRMAIGTSLVVIAASSSAALLGYLGHVQLDYRVALVVTLAASVGALVGARFAARIRVEVLRRGFSMLILVMGVMLMTRALGQFLT